MKRTKKTDKALAQQWGCSTKTVQNWRKAKAPLHDDARMGQWLASRRTLPPGTEQAAGTPAATKLSSDGGTGAESALRRLAGAERAAFEEFDTARRNGDALKTRTAQSAWLRLAESLRKADSALEADRKQRGELVSIEDVKQGLWLFGYYFNATWQESARRACWDIERETGIRGKAGVILGAMEQHLKLGQLMASAAAMAASQENMPAWLSGAMLQHAKGIAPAITERSEKLAEVLREILGEV